MAEASLAGRIEAPGRGVPGAVATMASAVRPRLPLPVLVYLLTVVTPVAFYAGPLYLTGLRAFLLLMIVPLSYRLLMGRYGRLYPTDVLFIAHTLWTGVSLLVNNPDQMLENAGIYGIEFFGGYVLARAYIRGPDEFSALVRTMLLLLLVTLPFAIHETMTGRPWIVEMIRRLPSVTSVPIVNIEPRMGLDRVQVVFAHPIHYGLFACSAFALCYVALKDEIGDIRRVAAAVATGLCCFLSLSSGAFLALLMQLFLIAWALALRSTRQRWGILVGLAALIYLAVELLSSRSPIRVFFSYATFSAHNAYWRGIIFEWGMMNVNDNAIFGLGLRDWVRPHFMASGSMDNFWLVQAVRSGYPGFLTLAVGYLIAMWRIGRRDFDADPRLWRYRRAWMFTFVGVTFTLCTVHIWTSIFSFIFFLFGAGMWMLAAQPSAAGGGAPAEAAPARPSRYARFSRNAPAPARAAGAAHAQAEPPPRVREAQAYARAGDRAIGRAGGDRDAGGAGEGGGPALRRSPRPDPGRRADRPVD